MTTLRAEKLTSCCSNGSDGPYRGRLTNHSSSVLSYSPGGANVQTQLTQFLGPMQVFTQNSISIGSAAFARLTDVANGHAETYRPRHVETSAAKKPHLCYAWLPAMGLQSNKAVTVRFLWLS